MTKRDWLINIENTADVVAAGYGQETVDFILGNHNASSIYDLDPCDYDAVFSELYQYEVDLYN